MKNKLLKCCFTSTETVGLLGTGAQDGHLDFHTAPELWKNKFNGAVYKNQASTVISLQ